jgi:hypothetical protein
VALQNPNFALHQLARRYGVQYVVAGHIHQTLRLDPPFPDAKRYGGRSLVPSIVISGKSPKHERHSSH